MFWVGPMKLKSNKWKDIEEEREGSRNRIDQSEEMGAGKNTAEFFKRRDEWRKHPMLGNQMRHATPGLGIALVAFGVYLVAEQVYNKINSSSHSHHHVCTLRVFNFIIISFSCSLDPFPINILLLLARDSIQLHIIY